MPPFKNHYATLDLPAFSGEEAVKSAYRRLARKFHPDLNNGDKSAEERFKAINEAYETLSSPDKRIKYDAALELTLKRRAPETPPPPKAAEKKQPPPPPPPQAAKKPPPSSSSSASSSSGSSKEKADTHTVGINELFENFLKKAAAPPPQAKAPRSSRPAAEPRRGEDISVETPIFPHEAESGVIKPVHAQHVETCRRCSGTGKLNGVSCPACGGEKSVSRTQKLEVRIPPGVKTGSKVRVAGEGGKGRDGGENGDLYLIIKVTADPGLRVEGADVYYTLSLSIPQAVLGAEIDVPTLDGLVKLSIPPRTPHGKTLRMKGRGAPNSGGRGDQLVTIAIAMPEKLSPKALALYQALADLRDG
ncbi:MAG: J domain-containing protein [Vampirovibrionales bacterium]|nr:J domain-containing protein [Vampirovibrionales bacterium]